jgi:hypothetical protein
MSGTVGDGMGERDDFLRELRTLARKKGLLLVIDVRKGKGSHYEVRLGNRRTIVPFNIGRNLRRSILKDLDLD